MERQSSRSSKKKKHKKSKKNSGRSQKSHRGEEDYSGTGRRERKVNFFEPSNETEIFGEDTAEEFFTNLDDS